ncbi:hypothetical protein RYA05_13530 [Pseudomonas syringae pv. actinidiae]|nr:hypothetical protein [Pseudomonas syringae pv. actinidiae]
MNKINPDKQELLKKKSSSISAILNSLSGAHKNGTLCKISEPKQSPASLNDSSRINPLSPSF